MSEITTQLTGETPEMQAERLALVDASRTLINQQATEPLPLQSVAAESGLQTLAGGLAESGIGVYQPYLEQAGYTMGDAQQTLMDSTAGLAGTTQMYDPNSAQAFFNPYENAAVQQALSDIQRQGAIQQAQQGSQAVGIGAFGGARQGIQESELTRNILNQQAQTAAQMRQAGYESAAQRSQNAFEAAKNRGQNAAQLGIAGGSALGTLGLQEASLGELSQNLNMNDINTAMTIGRQQQQQQQLGLDASYNNQMSLYNAPYQNLQFMSDILRGVPSSQQTITASSGGNPSAATQVLGTGLAGLSAVAGGKQAGLF